MRGVLSKEVTSEAGRTGRQAASRVSTLHEVIQRSPAAESAQEAVFQKLNSVG